MSTGCKQRKSERVVKNGKQDGIQRYKCKECGAVFRDSEPKYSAAFKMEVVMMYLNSMGIRAIGRVKKLHNSVVSYWVKQAGVIAKESFYEELQKVQSKDVQILEAMSFLRT